MVVDAKQTCPLHPSILPSLSSVLEQHDPISSIQVMDGSALDVLCTLFLLQWSEMKAHEKPIQSLLPAGLRLVTIAWACRRSPSPRTRAVSLFQTLFQPLKEEHPAVGGRDGEITMPFDSFNACPFIREENEKGQSVGCGDRETALTVRSRSTTRTPVTGCPPRRAW